MATLTREQAFQKLNELVKNQNLIKHCLAVEMAMRAYAKHFDMPEEEREHWAIVGLIHDADWEKYPEEHPNIIITWLAEQGASGELTNAVAAHGYNFNVEAKSLMAKTLRAVDELTGLIVAVALVKDKKLANVSVKSIKKKWKDKTFAKGVNREDIMRGAQEINIPLEDHIGLVLTAMQENAGKLGL